MTLDEAIKIWEEDAEKIGGNPQSDRHAERCRQLAEWLMELKELRNSIGAGKFKDMKETVGLLQELNTENDQLTSQLAEAKRLLKAAVDDFNKSLGAMYTCPYCKYVERKNEVCTSRKEQYCGDICEWRYADEALKLIES